MKQMRKERKEEKTQKKIRQTKKKVIKKYNKDEKKYLGCLVGFNGISTSIGYLIPEPFIHIYI